MTLEPYQERVIDEKRELDTKRLKLRVFIGSESWKKLPGLERSRLNRQL